MMKQSVLYLASQSPRRCELLRQLGIPFEVLKVNVDETARDNELAEDYVDRMAREKALAGWGLIAQHPLPVLGSDTAVVVNGEILGKPENREDARRMLNLLSGKTHQVMTAVALASKAQNKTEIELNSVTSVSDVSFKTLSNTEIEHYIATGEGDDKAGSYGIQGLAAVFITHLSGSYSGVMGLPLHETYELLNNAAIRQIS